MHHQRVRSCRPLNGVCGGVLRTSVLAGALLTASACSSTPSAGSPTPGATSGASAAGSAAYCDDLQALNKNVNQLQSLNPSTTNASEVQTIITDAQNNLSKAAQDASGSASIKINAIKTAYSALVAALSAVPSSLSATQVFQQVKPEITALTAAVKAAGAGSGCPSASSS